MHKLLGRLVETLVRGLCSTEVTGNPAALMALHFTSERPEDQFYTDFSNLNKLGEEVNNPCNV